MNLKGIRCVWGLACRKFKVISWAWRSLNFGLQYTYFLGSLSGLSDTIIPKEDTWFVTGADMPPQNKFLLMDRFAEFFIEKKTTGIASIRHLIFPSSKTCNSEMNILNHLHSPSMPRGPCWIILAISSTILLYPMTLLSAHSAIFKASCPASRSKTGSTENEQECPFPCPQV